MLNQYEKSKLVQVDKEPEKKRKRVKTFVLYQLIFTVD
uniref:Uncharacterized protein n=1 Tax=Tetranychus urticae TaxID=32264 RepID=T1KIQ9_TETUR